MNLFRSEEHARGWSLYYRAEDDYIMPVSDWATVFSSPLFKTRLSNDYLSHAESYLRDYHQALKAMGKSIPAAERFLATVLFTDIVGSTDLLSSMGDTAWRQLLDRHNEIVRAEIDRWRGREVDTAGDGFFATFDGTARAVQAVQSMIAEVRGLGIEIRAGLHTGEVEIVDGKPAGTAVHIAARTMSLAGPGELLVTSTVKETITGSQIRFEDRGAHQLRGVSGAWHLYAPVT